MLVPMLDGWEMRLGPQGTLVGLPSIEPLYQLGVLTSLSKCGFFFKHIVARVKRCRFFIFVCYAELYGDIHDDKVRKAKLECSSASTFFFVRIERKCMLFTHNERVKKLHSFFCEQAVFLSQSIVGTESTIQSMNFVNLD